VVEAEINRNEVERGVIDVSRLAENTVSVLVKQVASQVGDVWPNLHVVLPYKRLRREGNAPAVEADFLDAIDGDRLPVRAGDSNIGGRKSGLIDYLTEPDVHMVDS